MGRRMKVMCIDDLLMKVFDKCDDLKCHKDPEVQKLLELVEAQSIFLEKLMDSFLEHEIEKTAMALEISMAKRRALSVESKLTETRHKLGRMEHGMKINSRN